MQYIICGTGGQGILFATKVLGHIALMLGALCATGAGGVTAEEVRGTIEELAPERFRGDNLKAFDLGLSIKADVPGTEDNVYAHPPNCG